MLAAAAREAGCLAYRQAVVPDDPDEVLPAIEDQLVRADLMVTTGGVSMGGEHDVVKAALQQLGTITFRKVAMQPGMPQGFGLDRRRRGCRSSRCPATRSAPYVSFQVFVRPAMPRCRADAGLRLETVTGPS